MIGVSIVLLLAGVFLSAFFSGSETGFYRAIRLRLVLDAMDGVGIWSYDIAADRTELNNLAAKQPQRTQAMADAWEAWAVKALAKPWPYGKKKPKK